jgi:cyclic-di-GMP phosphodiesterase TipF (flagellum assembly factor)
MATVSNLLLIVAYALGATLAALLAPQAFPSLDPRTGLALGVGLFLGAALVHEILIRRGAQRETDTAIGLMRRTATETAADLDSARREINRLKQELASSTTTMQNQVQNDMALVRSVLADLAAGLEGRKLRPRLGVDDLPKNVDDLPRRDLATNDDILMQVVRQALDGNRVDLYLQPIVSLPQRKHRFYECFSRLRADDGTLIGPEVYLPLAAENGLTALIDNMLLLRCVHLIRRLRTKNRSAGFFLNISLRSLADESFFDQFVDFLQAEPELVESLVLEFEAADFANASDVERGRMIRLAGMGFRLSLDHVDSLDLDFVTMAAHGVRYVKVAAEVLLSPAKQLEASIAMEDFKTALARNDIDLVVNEVESERQVVGALDYRVDFGQGALFGEPRQAREAA